jgi:hypothetical protein
MRILLRVALVTAICLAASGQVVLAQQFGQSIVRETSDSQRTQRCVTLGARVSTAVADSLPGLLNRLGGCSFTGPAVAARLLNEPGDRTASGQQALYTLANEFLDERVFVALQNVAVNSGRTAAERIRAVESLMPYVDRSLVVFDRMLTGRWQYFLGNQDHPASEVGDQPPVGPMAHRVGGVLFEIAQQPAPNTEIGRAARDLLEQILLRFDSTAIAISPGAATISRRCGGGYILTSSLPVMVTAELKASAESGGHPFTLMPASKTVVLNAGPNARGVYRGSQLLASLPPGDSCVANAP